MWDKELENKLTSLLKDNNIKERRIEELESLREKDLNAVFSELLTVIDVFEKSEKIIRERELDKSEDSQKAIKRILLAKNKLLNILENNNIRKIEFVNNILNSDKCTVSETIPDSSLPNDYILEILKDGYERNGILLRRAEVVIVKN